MPAVCKTGSGIQTEEFVHLYSIKVYHSTMEHVKT